jgi:hypothetical protein
MNEKIYCKFYMKCMDGKICGNALTVKIRKELQSQVEPLCQYNDKPECFKEKINIVNTNSD